MAEEEIKTMAIRPLIEEAEKTGLIQEDSIRALNVIKVQTQEKIESLYKLFEEHKISYKDMLKQISDARKELEDKIRALNLDPDVLS